MASATNTGGWWGGFNRFIGGMQRVTGRVLFLFILLIVVLSIIGGLSGDGESAVTEVPDNGVVLWAPRGPLVEEASEVSTDAAFQMALFGQRPEPEVVLADVLEALRLATEDERVTTLVIDLDRFAGGLPSALHDVVAAMRAFREAGKTILVHGEYYTNADYLLASQADEILLHPFGMVDVTGYGNFGLYFRKLLENLKVTVNVFRVGTFKSAVEPFLRDDMSPEDEEASRAFLGTLWSAYTEAVEAGRGFEPGTLQSFIDSFDARLRDAGGDTAEAALAGGFVDQLVSRAALRDLLVERFGEADDKDDVFTHISLADFYEGAKDKPKTDGPAIAVITAAGAIQDGNADGGVTGGDAHADLIRQARDDEDVKAIVLRVDSPGGGVFASELIREELAAAKEQGLPIVVSMAGLAASGGYWISTPADEIIASPTTITGSIGIFGLIPTFEQGLAWAGVTEDGVGTTALSNGFSTSAGLSDQAKDIIQQSIEDGYEDFLTRVAESRGMTLEEVDAVAQGRVWAGETALQLGLVDRLGNLDDALASAAEKAGLAEGEYRVWRVKDERTQIEKLIEELGVAAISALAPEIRGPIGRLLGRAHGQLSWVSTLDDPQNRYAVCLECEALETTPKP